ncbi:sensor domain-containing diguanylate cyclase [Anaerobacillus alkaliphilus]|uniref:Sensor domain-containing diguanylate cyclase n=1 Tax=Anaerobacillus alkaliphilus TaxID=1548597 RepID=A0A4Q0VSR7_9BACI|nr:sensor domain-containing diguanylate cyclase [Anaerobacillus alkaliphilus]RXI99852.1 sensor domain-containing diguanylate cyclase [Anaerobacillus alkaliphilus]
MSPFLVLLFTAILAGVIANFVRFHVNDVTNKFILITLSLVLVKTYSLLFNSTNTAWTIFLIILIAAYSLQLKGAIVFAIISWLAITINNEINLYLLISYLIFASFIGLVAEFYFTKDKKSQQSLTTLLKQSKQLDVFREISLSMQQTLQLDKLLQIILISVTAGHGLGFNRAMIFLKSSDNNQLNGIMGIGPMNANEGFGTWERLAASNLKLLDLIKLNYDKESIDPELNALIKSISINLDNDNVLEKALREGVPYNVQAIDEKDFAQQLFYNYFQMQAFAIIPLLNQGNQIGVLIIDNIVNNQPITEDDIDSVIPLANQAAIAIEQANLYKQIEMMALNDNLTGLLNQRSFELYSNKYFTDSKEAQEPLSIIIFDIDSFKHYNDTNGHLLGNEVLTKLSQIVKSSVRDQDLAFRFGGEEFVVILPNTSEEKALLVGERIRENIEIAIFPNEELQPTGTLTVSVGVASTQNIEFESILQLIEAADNALYKAKNAGKNRVELFKGDKSYV